MACRYCGKNQNLEFCSKECRSKYQAFIEKEKKIKKGFCIAIVISIALIIVSGVMLSSDWMLFTIGASVGISFIIFPLATPQTSESFGVSKSILVVRICGGMCILLGLFLAFL